jgi:hypothetical protein
MNNGGVMEILRELNDGYTNGYSISGDTLPLSIWDLALPHSRYPVWV